MQNTDRTVFYLKGKVQDTVDQKAACASVIIGAPWLDVEHDSGFGFKVRLIRGCMYRGILRNIGVSVHFGC